MEITFSIIGTAGRKEDGKRLSKNHFEAMCLVSERFLDRFRDINYPITHLVSGGAAWSDHVAVKLFLDKKVPNLRLYLPCQFEAGSFVDNGSNDSHKNPGSILNYYHKQFQLATHVNSLSQIQVASIMGAELIPVKGSFYGRNAMVSKSDFLLAITFGNGAEVKAGGTAHTVKCYLDRIKKEGIYNKSFHYDLNSGEVFPGCTVPDKDSIIEKTKQTARSLNIPFHQVAGFHTNPP